MIESKSTSARGFTLIEVLVSLFIVLIVMAAVFGLLMRGQGSFEREPEVADMTSNARAVLSYLNRDLLLAGYRTPPAAAIGWNDGGGIQPDSITIVYSDPNVPTCRPDTSAASATIGQSSMLLLDPLTCEPGLATPETTFPAHMFLTAIETADCNGDGLVGFYNFETTQAAHCTNAGGPGSSAGPSNCSTVNVNHNPSSVSGLNLPGGFNREVRADCAVIGFFRIVQYRVHPPLPTPNPVLERRDLSTGGPWVGVANNIENLQIQYGSRNDEIFTDVPPVVPEADDPGTWITSVKWTVTGRSEQRNLAGSSQGQFAAEDVYLRRAFTTVTSLRNQSEAAERNELEGLFASGAANP